MSGRQFVELELLQALYYSPDPAQTAQAEELLRGLGEHPVAILFWRHHISRQLNGGYPAQLAAAERLRDRPTVRRPDLRSQLYGVIVGYMARASNNKPARERGAALLRLGVADPELARRFFRGCATDGVLHSQPEMLPWLDRRSLLLDIIEALPESDRAAIHTIRGPGYRWGFPPPARLIGALPGVTALEIDDVAPSREADDYRRLAGVRTLKLTVRYSLPPEGLGALAALETLDLSDSEGLQALPGDLGRCLRLHTLDARRCRHLSAVGEGLAQAAALAVLRLDGAKALSALPEALGALPRLRTLGLAGCGRLGNVPVQLDGIDIDITGCTSLTSAPPSLRAMLHTSDHAQQLAAVTETVSLTAAKRKKVATRIRALIKSKLWAEVCVAIDSLNRFSDPALEALLEKALFTEVRKRLRGRDEACFEQGLAILARRSRPTTLLALWEDSDPASPETLGAQLRGLRGERPVLAAWAMIALLPPDQVGAITALSPAIFPRRPEAPDWEALGRLSGLQTLRLRTFPDWPAVAIGLRSLRALTLHGDLSDGLPAALALLPALEELVLERTHQLPAMPPVLRQLPRLRSLSLERCSLTDGGDLLAALAGLEVLSICGTPLSIPSVERLPRLRELRLEATAQEQPPAGLLDHPTVEVLGRDALGGASVRSQRTALPSLRGMSSLRHLDLSHHKILTALPGADDAPPALDALTVQGCRALSVLPSWLAARPLRLLDIRDTPIVSLPEGVRLAEGGTLRLRMRQLLPLLGVIDQFFDVLADLSVEWRGGLPRDAPGDALRWLLPDLADVPVMDLSPARRLSAGVTELDLSLLRYKRSLEVLDLSGWADLRRVSASAALPPSLRSIVAGAGVVSGDAGVQGLLDAGARRA